MSKKIEKNLVKLEQLKIEYISCDSIKPNAYNPNRQSEHDFELLCRSMEEDGFCVAAETPILCADLIWRPAGDLKVGQEIIAFDEISLEGGNRAHGRRLRTAVVEFNEVKEDDLFLVTTEHGSVKCNASHPWLGRVDLERHDGREWIKTCDLLPGQAVVHLIDYWDVETSYEAGWLSGFLDGEGSLCVNLSRGNEAHRLAVYQKPGITADRMIREMTSRCEAKVRIDIRTKSNPKWSDMVTVRVDCLEEIMRIVGIVRPERLMKNAVHFWEDRSISRMAKDSLVKSVEVFGRGLISSLATSTKTYIAAGFAMHNTQPVIVIRSTKEIVDGEHRWRAAQSIGLKEIPVVFVDMSPEQMRISTLRHNRARGSEDADLAAAVLRDLARLGVLEEAVDSLMLDEAEVYKFLEEIEEPELLDSPELETIMSPFKGMDDAGNVVLKQSHEVVSSTAEASDALRQQRKNIEELKSQDRYNAVQRDLQVYRLTLSYVRDEADIVKMAVGKNVAEGILALCTKEYERKHSNTTG